MKLRKIILILVAVNVLLFSITSVNTQASIVTKPLTITAKKVAKELSEDSAISMANKIVSDLIMTELTSGANNKVDIGYSAVCMDGSKSMNDCPVEKRAQVKTKLTSGDKRNISKTVESIIEKKTNTSSRWGKFLDFFIPIFLLSGLVVSFKAMLDDDSESLMDEIALESLKELKILKPLGFDENLEEIEVLDFSSYVSQVRVTSEQPVLNRRTIVEVDFKKEMKMTYMNNYKLVERTISPSRTYRFILNVGMSSVYLESEKLRAGNLLASSFGIGTQNGAVENVNDGNGKELYRSMGYETKEQYEADTTNYWINTIHNPIANGTSINHVMSNLISTVNRHKPINVTFIGVNPITEQQPIYETDYGNPKGLEGIKNPDGTTTLPGVDSFTYIYNNTYVYPSPDSVTGWKDSVTGDDIELVPEDVIVNGGDIESPIKEDEFETEFTCKRDFDLPTLKPIGNAFTNAFPFSIPWDLKKGLDNAFGGVGDSKPTFNLTFLGDGVVLTMPDMIDRWMPFARTVLVLFFDVSVLYMFYRFMKGGSE